jgi:hypothetical protein
MSALPEIVPSLVDHIKQTLVGLKMPRAIEIFDVIVRRLERGEITAIEAIDVPRSSRCVRTAASRSLW